MLITPRHFLIYIVIEQFCQYQQLRDPGPLGALKLRGLREELEENMFKLTLLTLINDLIDYFLKSFFALKQIFISRFTWPSLVVVTGWVGPLGVGLAGPGLAVSPRACVPGCLQGCVTRV